MASCVVQTQGAHRLCLEPIGSAPKDIWGVGPSPGGGRDLLYQLGLGIPCGQGA